MSRVSKRKQESKQEGQLNLDMSLMPHYLRSSIESVIISHDSILIQSSVKVLFKEVYAWVSVDKPAEFRSHHITHGACASWVMLPWLPGSQRPQLCHFTGRSGINSDVSCFCGNNSRSCSARLHNKYDVSRSREKTRPHNTATVNTHEVWSLYRLYLNRIFFHAVIAAI